MAATPKVTAALGLLYSSPRGWFGSPMSKFEQHGLDNATGASGKEVFANDARIAVYMSWDAAFGYRGEHGRWSAKGWSVSMDINDSSTYTSWPAQSVSGAPLYFGLPGGACYSICGNRMTAIP